MVFISIIVIVALGLSLYDYFSNRDVERLSFTVSKSRNPRYGAFELRKAYTYTLTSILSIFILLLAGFVAIDRGVGFGKFTPPEKEIKSDTFKLTLNAPPVEPIETLPPSYTLEGRTGSGKTTPESVAQSEPQQNESTSNSEDVSNKAKAGDQGKQRPNENPEKPTNRKSNTSSEQEVKDFEKQLFADAKGVQEREKIKKEAEERKKKWEEKMKNTPPPTNQSNANKGGNNGTKGKTMVHYELNGRQPHNNDMWYVRNPGYTCGQGTSGEVIVKIKVNSNGDVVSAVPAESYSELNSCLIQQSIAYAKKSRFSPSSKPSEEGIIIYRFVP